MTFARSFRSVLLVAAFAGSAHAGPPRAPEPTDPATAEARQWVKRGTEEYEKEHWQAAYEAFLKAWELKKHFAIAANLAESEMHLGRWVDAAEHWKFNLANLPADRADRRGDAETRLAECRAHVTVVRVTVSVEGANISLDGNAIGTSPLPDETWLAPGHHVLVASREGFSTASREFDSGEGESRDVTLTLEPPKMPAAVPEAPAPAADRAPPPQSVVPPRTVVLLGGAAVTLAVVGVGVAFTLSSNAASDDAASLRDEIRSDDPAGAATNSECAASSLKRPPACDALREKLEDASRARNLALGSFIAAGAVGAATLGTFLLWPAGGTESRARPPVSLSAWNPGGGFGARVSGRF